MLAWGVDFTAAELRTGVQQTDGFTCGPTVAMVASALLDPMYADGVADYGAEQHRIHTAANRIWPKKLGTTPWGVAATITAHTAELGTRYGWRLFRGRRDRNIRAIGWRSSTTSTPSRRIAAAGWPAV